MAQPLPGWGRLGLLGSLVSPWLGTVPGAQGCSEHLRCHTFPQAMGCPPESACVSFHLPNKSKHGQGRAPETSSAAAPLAFVSSPLHSSRYVLIL